jgi:hypothetical protein
MPVHQEQTGQPCQVCRQMKMFVRTVERPNHVIHAIVTLFLCGLWLPVWIVACALAKTSEWRCTGCGAELGVTLVAPGPAAVKPTPHVVKSVSGKARCGACGTAAIESNELGRPVFDCAKCGRLV